jgi:hypothetical protein
LSFSDITEEWFLDRLDTTGPGRHWSADPREPTIEGRRIHMRRIGFLLAQHQPVTAETLARLRLRRCRGSGRCVRPDHQSNLADRGVEAILKAVAARQRKENPC